MSAKRAAGESQKAMNASTSSRTGPVAARTTCQWRTRQAAARPDRRQQPELELELDRGLGLERDPEPGLAACLIAPFDPRVSTVGVSPWVARNSSLRARVPEPGSRTIQWREASSETATQRRFANGSSGAVTSTIGFSAKAWPVNRPVSGILPVIATSA